MDERLLNRRFNVALSKEEIADGRSLDGVCREAEEDEEYLLRKAANPMDVKDAIKRILLAKKDRDFFRYCITWHIVSRRQEPLQVLQRLAAQFFHHSVAQLSLQGPAGTSVGFACRLLELPLPEMDDLDRVTWNVSSAEVSKAYR